VVEVRQVGRSVPELKREGNTKRTKDKRRESERGKTGDDKRI
jgi:hypothetical protein